jgi:GT2 family glycosyltransferase
MKIIDLSIIIVNFNTKELLNNCIESVINNSEKIRYEIIVVDNASKDGIKELVKRFDKKYQIRLLENKTNVGFGRANNQGMKASSGKYILLLNTDTLIKNRATEKMFSWMELHPKVGVASCALLNNDGSMQETGGYFPSLIRVFSWMTIQDIPLVDNLIHPFHPMRSKYFRKGEAFYKEEKELDWVKGAFFLIRRKVVDKIGYFDKDYFMYTEEVEYCYRIKNAGWKIYFVPTVSVTHLGGASGIGSESVIKEFQGVKLFYKKHYPPWQYPLLRLFLKIGALGRIFIFGLLEGRDSAKTYAKAFREA